MQIEKRQNIDKVLFCSATVQGTNYIQNPNCANSTRQLRLGESAVNDWNFVMTSVNAVANTSWPR
jgi:hypothetical protein